MLTYSTGRTDGVYTLSEFIASLSPNAVSAANQDELSRFVGTREPVWMGIKDEARDDEPSCAATQRIVREGWRRGVDLMQEVASQVTLPTPRAVRRVQRWMPQGDDVDMQQVWNGNLDKAWRGTTRDWRSGPQRIRILVDSIEGGGQGADIMRWRGVAALKLADALTEAGYSVQVESVISAVDSSSKTQRFVLRTIVKQYTDPVDLLTMAATTALPAYFRALMHQWGLQVAKHYRVMGVSYQVEGVTPVAHFADPNDDAPCFIIPRTVNDAAKATKCITDIVEKIEAGE